MYVYVFIFISYSRNEGVYSRNEGVYSRNAHNGLRFSKTDASEPCFFGNHEISRLFQITVTGGLLLWCIGKKCAPSTLSSWFCAETPTMELCTVRRMSDDVKIIRLPIRTVHCVMVLFFVQ